MNDVTVEGILHALSDPVRVQILVDIVRAQYPQICSNFLIVNDKTLPKSTLSQHFKILREAGLIRSERKGVEMHNVSRCEELAEPFGGLVTAIVESYKSQQMRVKRKKR